MKRRDTMTGTERSTDPPGQSGLPGLSAAAERGETTEEAMDTSL